jgi:hypothetical protein
MDCDDYNTLYDPPKGHSYFLQDEHGQPGAVFRHIAACVDSGRVPEAAALPGRCGVL